MSANNDTSSDTVLQSHGFTLKIVSQLIGKLDAVSRQSATYIVAFFGGFLIVSSVLLRAGVFGAEAALRIGSSGLLECLIVGSALVLSGSALSYIVFRKNAEYASKKLDQAFDIEKRLAQHAQEESSGADQVEANAAQAVTGGNPSAGSQTQPNGGRTSDQTTITQGLG